MLLVPAVIAAAVSCGLDEVGEGTHTNPEGIWNGQEPGPQGTEHCYFTVMEYPDGFDWRSEQFPEDARCFLTVYADSIPVRKIPAGKGTEISLDPERHRLFSGHVYTDYTDGNVTVIRKDGKELLRWQGNELVTDMVVADDTVYTLSVPVNGTGFRYRVNGKPLVQRDAGRCFGHLRNHCDTVAFCFSQPDPSSSALIPEKLYSSKNGKVEKVEVADSLVKIWDMMVYEGEVCIIASVQGRKGPLMFGEDSHWRISYVLGSELIDFRFTDTDVLCIDVLCCQYGDKITGMLCKGFLDSAMCALWRTISACQVNEDGYYYVSNDTEAGNNGKILRNGQEYRMPAGYAVMGISPVAVKDGDMYVGLSSRSGGRPSIWMNGSMTDLDINGYIARMSF